ncbi:MAG: AraC family transcriptional regulator [Spirochaetaceae bacterium]|nr:AraC family transcriptional regulator [Spirochaetaceae bacterium]
MMNYEVVEIEEKKVAGLKIRTTNEDMKCLGDMSELWQKFFGENLQGVINNPLGKCSYGVYYNYESDLTKPYDYMAGLEVCEANSDFDNTIIPGGSYARFTAKGNVQQVVGELWQSIWTSGLDRSYVCDFESYRNDSKGMDKQTVDIYISLK